MRPLASEELVPTCAGELCITRHGDPAGPLVLHLEGHRAQLISLPSAYLKILSDAAMHSVCVDNRDVGKSFRAQSSYTLEDMAEDIHQLIAHLGRPAIITGRSMGGAIAQLLALKYPEDVAGLGLFYTFALSEPRTATPPGAVPFANRTQFIDYQLRELPTIAGSRYPMDREEICTLANAMWDRGVSWAGWERQRQAMEATAPWADRLSEIAVPTVIIHGGEDPIIDPRFARDLANAITTADLHIIDGLGHQQPTELSELFADLTLRLNN